MSSVIVARPQVAHTAKKYTPNMVLNHAGDMLMIQSNDAKVMVSPNTIIDGPANRRQRSVMETSPVRSWRTLEPQ